MTHRFNDWLRQTDTPEEKAAGRRAVSIRPCCPAVGLEPADMMRVAAVAAVCERDLQYPYQKHGLEFVLFVKYNIAEYLIFP